MVSETKICRSCSAAFVVEPDDLNFYKKIDVPSPQMCPLCRAQHRLSFRNERTFYKRKCDRCHKEVISMYSPNKPYTVWCYECWFSDDWDVLSYGRKYDPTRSFLDQFTELWEQVPKIALVYVRSVNSEYVNISADNKNCYMIVESSNNENCTHCYWIQQCRDCTDISFAHQTELSYESDDCYNSYRLFYCKGCHDSHDGYFLLDCYGCSDCIGCVNLRNKKYHVFNQPLSKEKYEAFLASAKLDSYSGVEAMRKKFAEFAAMQPKKFAEMHNAVNCSGNYIEHAKNCHSVFHCYDAEDCKYGVHVWRNAKECVDCDTAGRGAERIYNSINAGIDTSHYICSSLCWTCTFMQYSYYCFNSNHCFGSVGLRKKDYCVLNTPYDKSTYELLTATIIESMRNEGTYGEFFPKEVSTFGYNESAAHEQVPLTKEEALQKGFKWEEYPRGTFGKETIAWDKVADSIKDIGNLDVPQQIFACLRCHKNYRIIPIEFAFYKQLQIPLPRLCPDCRHTRRFAARGPSRVWDRTCSCGGSASDNGVYKNSASHFHGADHCPHKFQTSYSPAGDEIVYCEQCYNAEVV